MNDQQRAGLHVSSEVLMHFRCGHGMCQQWWSIADWVSVRDQWPHAYVYCPRCGRGQTLLEGILQSSNTSNS
jgi:hypothetical protein